nr:MAG TPA: hypothetical protein [Caudoviricetes sp.]
MTDKEIIQALRICFRDIDDGAACPNCPLYGNENCLAEVMGGAADLLEWLSGANAHLYEELEWKDKVIALAQRKQAEAEAERDALLEYAKTMQECEMCKNDSFCHLRGPMKDDCKHCQRASDCPCQKCEENNCWEWRGLPEAPAEGEKA